MSLYGNSRTNSKSTQSNTPTHWENSFTAYDITLRNGEKTRYYEGGSKDGVPLIFIHGWPAIAETWKHQLAHFAKLNYRVIAPDVRGYGDSSAPRNKRAYSTKALSNEYIEFANLLGVKKAVWVAHDWGTGVTHPLASHHPDHFLGMASLAIPYHNGERGLEYITSLVNRDIYPAAEYPWGQWDYMQYYRTNTREAIKDFESATENVIKANYLPRDLNNTDLRAPTATIQRDGGWFGGSAKNLPDIPLNATVLDQSLYTNLVKGVKRHGWFPPTAYYLNHDVNAAYTLSERNGGVVDIPVLFLDAVYDLVASPSITPKFAEAQANYTTDLTYERVEAAHWLHLEKPDEVNALLEQWLNKIL
ncbi:Alpha/Beta hydrolase protein [Paraphoma chrysanthemicola]|uniref:Alpha/Beta hydrolase protein n=1 Tax=Paraphoma chrysanthemicola TaxID=798071 RepID=A0A8K0VRH9_9PLEO|nr:Alpha/Beta hydrolase protein [Paraphoma chrysanthemicola]